MSHANDNTKISSEKTLASSQRTCIYNFIHSSDANTTKDICKLKNYGGIKSVMLMSMQMRRRDSYIITLAMYPGTLLVTTDNYLLINICTYITKLTKY